MEFLHNEKNDFKYDDVIVSLKTITENRMFA